jgi:hypothetical protein
MHGAYNVKMQNLCSAPPYGNDKNLKILKYIKLMTINYSIMALNIGIFNNRPP